MHLKVYLSQKRRRYPETLADLILPLTKKWSRRVPYYNDHHKAGKGNYVKAATSDDIRRSGLAALRRGYIMFRCHRQVHAIQVRLAIPAMTPLVRVS